MRLRGALSRGEGRQEGGKGGKGRIVEKNEQKIGGPSYFPILGSDPDISLLSRRRPLQYLRPIPVSPDVSCPLSLPVKPLGEYLLYPLHYLWQLEPIRRHKVEGKPVILQLQSANLKHIPLLSLAEHEGEKVDSVGASEQRLTIVDAGTYFVPDTLTKCA
jgi:hypothetical protein